MFDNNYDENWNEQAVPQVDELEEDDELNQSSDFYVSGRNDVRRQQLVGYLGELSSTQIF